MEQKEVQSRPRHSLVQCTHLFQALGLQNFSLSSKTFLLPTSALLVHKLALACITALVVVEIVGIVLVINTERGAFQEQQSNVTSKTSTAFAVQYGSYLYINIIVFVSALHSWVSNMKAVRAFNNFDKVCKTFVSELGHVLKYDEFIKKFKTLAAVYQVIFVISSVVTLGFIFYHAKASTTFYWAILILFPYFAAGVAFLKFIFYMELITVNVDGIFEVLRKAYNLKQLNRVEAFTFNQISVKSRAAPENETIFDTIMILKRLYGTVYETSVLVNDICGLSMIFQLIMVIFCNSSAGFKVYLVVANLLPVGRIGIPVYTIVLTYGLLVLTIHYACKTYKSVDSIVLLLNKFEFDQFERQQHGVQEIIAEFLAQIGQQPIKYSFGRIFVIEKAFYASITMSILTYVVILAQSQQH